MLSVILGWPERATIFLMGVTVITYTTMGGVKAVTWSDVQQMCIIFVGLVIALATLIHLMPPSVSLADALYLAGAAGRLNAVTTDFDWNDQFTLWSGLIGGTFLFLSYFGCDQSQVQRYLTGKSIAQSRLSLIFNAVAKIPMQFFILFIGAMVFVFHLFVQPPMLFEQSQLERLQSMNAYRPVAERYRQAFESRRQAARELIDAHRARSTAAEQHRLDVYRAAQREMDRTRDQATRLVESTGGEPGFTDTNYIFLSFVTKYLPVGLVGLIIAVIFAATMSASAGEINSLATVTMVDLYRRYFHRSGTDHHYLMASRWATVFWGAYAIAFAGWGRTLGSLIVAVNKVGSLFYGSLLGVFVLAFFFRRVGGTAAFVGMLAGEAAIFWAFFTRISFLWYNVIGCAVVIVTALAVAHALGRGAAET